MIKVIAALEKYLLIGILILFPVFVVSATSAPLTIPKLALLSFGVCLVFFLHLIGSIIKGGVSFNIGKFDVAVLVIMLSYLISGILMRGNKMETFAFPGTATFVIASCLLYFLLNQFKKSDKGVFSSSLIISGVLLSLIILFTQIQVFAKIPQLPAFVRDASFNPTGGVVPSLIYLVALLPLVAGYIISQKDTAKRLFFAVSAAIILAGIAVNVGNILPGKSQSPRFAPLQTSWETSVDALKASPILGVGPGNYLTAFSQLRPLSYNQTDIWPVKFATATNFYLTALTEVGLLGLLGLIILFFLAYKFVSKGKFNSEKALLAVPLVLFAMLPASPVPLFALFVILALISNSEERKIELMGKAAPLAVTLVGIPFFTGIFAFGYIGVNVLRAEQYYKKALEALSRNEAQATYDAMRQAVSINPRVDRYRASLAQINMALASSIAAKENITDADRTAVSQLIQSAIAEGKATVALNPQRSGNWEILAGIYRTIMPFAQGADGFAIQTYSQAVALDPINPNLRITLGGTYYALGRFDEAIQSFALAVAAKNDLANAHYNLSAAYREKGEIEKAIEEMNIVLSLVEKDSNDYQTASAELTALEGKRPPKAEAPENLTQPAPVEESNIVPPLQLPSDSTPPQTP